MYGHIVLVAVVKNLVRLSTEKAVCLAWPMRNDVVMLIVEQLLARGRSEESLACLGEEQGTDSLVVIEGVVRRVRTVE